jgi:lipoprotein-anchoring transpeptidase ErfK/SrfK
VVLAVGGSLGMIPGTALGEPRNKPATTGPDTAGAHGPSDDGSGALDVGLSAGARVASAAPDDAASPSTGDESTDEETARPPRTEPSLGVPPDSGTGRRVVYDISAQRVWLVEADGDIARSYLVSGPLREEKLPPRTYEVYSKSRHAVALNYRETMEYMVRFAYGQHAAIGFHDIPVRRNGDPVQTREALGTPRSSGCVRQWRPDAKALWDFTEVGSTVVVVA